MQSGRSLQDQVTEVLENEVIATLKQKDPTQIPVTLLIGLHTLIESTHETGLLSRMYEASFPMWLRKYCEILDECKA